MLPRTLYVAAVTLALLLAAPLSAVEARPHRHHSAVRRGQDALRSGRSPAPAKYGSLTDQPAAGHNWGNPVADPKAVVLASNGKAKFTVLTDSIIRMQYAADGNFANLDVQTYTILNRNLPVPSFTTSTQGSVLLIHTASVTLRYDTSDATSFNHQNLQVVVLNGDGAGTPSVWTAAPGLDAFGNLHGTVRTLDQSNGLNTFLDCGLNVDPNAHCSEGIIGTQGYAVIDDTGAPAFDAPQDNVWTWLRARNQPAVDPNTCTIDAASRRDCGFGGIAQDECARRGCCWLASEENQAADAQEDESEQIDRPNGVPQCFYSTTSSLDLYFLGHGRRFKQALLEYTSISGKIPAPPRYQLGVYFSRYWAYSDYEEYALVQEYIDHQVPLDILVTDMDWHDTFYSQSDKGVVDQAGQRIGWTGFTFDSHLFPNTTAFFAWCKAMGLKNTLNVHPASGMQPWEDKYAAMATAMGQDPAKQVYVPYNATDVKYNTNWLQIVMQPLVEQGVDFWWLDWQQGEQWIKEARLNPTQILNYLFYSNPTHWANGKRPAILHRWGGLGNHRYQAGFSGDVIPTWDSLAFQPYFTATASNVAYGWWSHDIGGHTQMPGAELYTRWVQWGVFSPIFRTHCTKDRNNDRRIWLFPYDNYKVMRTFSRIRAALVPYIADHALYTYETGQSLVLPLYYEWPLAAQAYPASGEFNSSTSYLFGRSLLASPIVAPVDPSTNMASKKLWMPPGQWVHFFQGDVVVSPPDVGINFTAQATLEEMPLWARAGAIVPLRPLPSTSAPGSALIGSAQLLPDTLQLLAFLGGNGAPTSGSLLLREDAGDSVGYQQGEWASTAVSYEVGGAEHDVIVLAVAQQSVFPGFMSQRAYEIHLRGVFPAQGIMLQTDSGATDVPFQPFYVQEGQMAGRNSWTYDAATLTLIVHVRAPMSTAVNSKFGLQIQLLGPTTDAALSATVGFPGRLARLQRLKGQLDSLWHSPSMVYQDLYPNFLLAGETASRINGNPPSARNELQAFEALMSKACTEMKNLTCAQKCDPNLIHTLTTQLYC